MDQIPWNSSRIALAVASLVDVIRDVLHLGRDRFNLTNHLDGVDRMRHYRDLLLGAQRLPTPPDRSRHAQHADIVQESSQPQMLHRLFTQTRARSHRQTQHRDMQTMAMRIARHRRCRSEAGKEIDIFHQQLQVIANQPLNLLTARRLA